MAKTEKGNENIVNDSRYYVKDIIVWLRLRNNKKKCNYTNFKIFYCITKETLDNL